MSEEAAIEGEEPEADSAEESASLEEIVDETTDTFRAPSDDGLNYPGDRPAYSYVVDGETIIPILYKGNAKSIESAYVRLNGREVPIAALIEGMHAVVVYGSLTNPKELGNTVGGPVVSIKAKLDGFEPVHNLLSSRRGNTIAELVPSTATTEVNVVYVTDEQLARIDAREQLYDLHTLSSVRLETGQEISALVNIGVTPLWQSADYGGPIGVAEIPAYGRQYNSMSQQAALTQVIREFDLAQHYNINTPRELIDTVTKGNREIRDYIVSQKDQRGTSSAWNHVVKPIEVSPANSYTHAPAIPHAA